MQNALYRFSIQREKVADTAPRITAPEEAAQLVKSLGYDQQDQEHLLVLMLDAKNNLRGLYVVSVGLIDRAHSHAREVFRTAIMAGAARILLAHNHPSGDPCPSKQDLACTKELCEAGKVLGIDVVDHVIVAEPVDERRYFYSMRENGQMYG